MSAKTFVATQCLRANNEADRSRSCLHELLDTEAMQGNTIAAMELERTRVRDSGEWLLRDEKYKTWTTVDVDGPEATSTSAPMPILLVIGGPGTGKTYVASRFISDLRDNPAVVVAFFYIQGGMNSQHTPTAILKTLASQVAEAHEPYARHVQRKCRGSQRHSCMAGEEAIWEKLFIQPFSQQPDIYRRPLVVVVDGLGEALRLTKARSRVANAQPYGCCLSSAPNSSIISTIHGITTVGSPMSSICRPSSPKQILLASFASALTAAQPGVVAFHFSRR